jgi:hypothetical protein
LLCSRRYRQRLASWNREQTRTSSSDRQGVALARDPRRLPDTARDIAQLFARAHIVLAALKAQQ